MVIDLDLHAGPTPDPSPLWIRLANFKDQMIVGEFNVKHHSCSIREDIFK